MEVVKYFCSSEKWLQAKCDLEKFFFLLTWLVSAASKILEVSSPTPI